MAEKNIVEGGPRPDSGPARRNFWDLFTETHSVLALMLVAVVGAVMILLFFVKVPDANRDFFNVMIGSLFTSGVGVVIKFYFDGSKSEQVRNAAAVASGGQPPAAEDPAVARAIAMNEVESAIARIKDQLSTYQVEAAKFSGDYLSAFERRAREEGLI